MYNSLLNLFITLQNGQMSNRSFILQPRKKNSEFFLKILWREGFIIGYKISCRNSNIIKIFLKYKNNKPVISTLKIISLPGQRIFYSAADISKMNSNKMFIVFSTKYGFTCLNGCKKYQIGGEPFVLLN